MDTGINPGTGLKPPPLTSDKLNYLVWRYLQEAGYGEAATKLQRDWNLEPERLSFAEHIKGQALVSLVQKGLRYHHLSLTIDENGRPSKQLTPGMLFFGPEDAGHQATRLQALESTTSNKQHQPDDVVSNGIQARQTVDFVAPIPNDPIPPTAPKRGRKTPASNTGERVELTPRKPSAPHPVVHDVNATEVEHLNGQASIPERADNQEPGEGQLNEHNDDADGAKPDDRMDIDTESAGGNPGQELPIEILPPVHTLTNGESRAVQVAPAQVHDLASSTSILTVGGDRRLSKVIWRPKDGPTLVASGDKFCGRWEFGPQRMAAYNEKPELQDVFATDSESSIVSAMAWSDDGAILAVATYSHNAGHLHLFYGNEFSGKEVLSASERAVTALQWQQASKQLIGLTLDVDVGMNDSHGSAILCWDMSDRHTSPAPLSVSIPELILDIDCASHGNKTLICAAGQGAAYHCELSDDVTSPQKWVADDMEGVQWTFIRCSWTDESTASVVAASADPPCIWLPAKNALKADIHNGSITGLELRPGPPRHEAISCEFATASQDGTIKIWQCNEMTARVDLVQKLTMGNNNPVMSLTYSLDGSSLAGASYDLVRIWNAGYGHHQMAEWKSKDVEWRGSILKEDDLMSVGGASSFNGESGPLIADHCLMWDADGQTLAFGLANQIAILNFPR